MDAKRLWHLLDAHDGYGIGYAAGYGDGTGEAWPGLRSLEATRHVAAFG